MLVASVFKEPCENGAVLSQHTASRQRTLTESTYSGIGTQFLRQEVGADM